MASSNCHIELFDDAILDLEGEELKQNIADIPEELIIYILQWLNINDIYEFEKTCRYLCFVAQNKNSLYHLKIHRTQFADNLSAFNKYHHPRYLHIQSLHLDTNDAFNNNEKQEWLQMLPTFRRVKKLYYDNGADFSIPVQIFHQKFRNFSTLQIVSLTYMKTHDIFNFIINCKNITKLALQWIDNEDQQTSIYVLIDQLLEKKVNDYPFMQLEEFSVDIWSVFWNLDAQYLTYWILGNGKKNKTFSITNNEEMHDDDYRGHFYHFFNPTCNDQKLLNMQKNALLKVKYFNLESYDKMLLNHISKMVCNSRLIQFEQFSFQLEREWESIFHDEITYFPLSINLIKSLDILVSNSRYSQFIWKSNYWFSDIIGNDKCLYMLKQWPLELQLVLNSSNNSFLKVFDEIEILLNIDIDNESEQNDMFDYAIKPWLELKESMNIWYNVTFYDCSKQHTLFNAETITKLQKLTAIYPHDVELELCDSARWVTVCF